MQVSTTSRPTQATLARATAIATHHPFDLVDYRDRDPGSPSLLVGRTGLVLAYEEQRFRWHPGLLHTRIEAGVRHPLVRVTGLQRGDRVFDSSLGLGTDARFLAHITGRRVVAVEAIPAIALLTAEGLASVQAPVDVLHGDGAQILASLPDDSFDVVQGDPMFPPGTGVTHSLDVLRACGWAEPLSPAWLHHAQRVARRSVVIRDIAGGTLLEDMACPEVLTVGRGRPRYGVWRSA